MNGELIFRDMTKAEYSAYYDWTTRHYAESMIISGGQPDMQSALAFAKEDLNECLTDGINTPDTYFYIIENGDGRVGLLVWQEDVHEKGAAFILDILIDEGFRRRGYATQAVKMLFDKARELAYKKCRLNVFNFNVGAKSVYEKCGMRVEKEFNRTTLMIIDL